MPANLWRADDTFITADGMDWTADGWFQAPTVPEGSWSKSEVSNTTNRSGVSDTLGQARYSDRIIH